MPRERLIRIAAATGFLVLAVFLFVKVKNYLGELSTPGRTPIENALGIPAQTNPTPQQNSAQNLQGQASSPPPSSSQSSPPPPSQPSSGDTVLLNVPFTPQAPTGDWADPREQSGCEEASALMAVYWAEGKQITQQLALQQILAISDYEQATYGDYHDTNVADSIARIYEGYFHYSKVQAKYNITANDIKAELDKGNVVVVPTNGQKLNNPYYSPPGPLQHELVIKGYNQSTSEFIVNDPGTKHGYSYRYPISVVMNAIYDYATGDNEPIGTIVKAMIVVSK